MIFSREQKRILVKSGTVVLALFLIFICYSYVIPRTEVEIDTVYHLAAILSTKAESIPFLAHQINVDGFLNLMNQKFHLEKW